MAGSRKWFVYETDSSDTFAIERDESNTEAVNDGDNDYTGASTATYAIPRNVKPRVGVYENADGSIRRNIVVLTQANFGSLETDKPSITDAVSSQTLNLRGKVGERIRLPFAADTALNDGDAT